MKIGINASFLRKPGTGIGQVTLNFLQKLTEIQDIRFVLYCEEEPKLGFVLPENFEVNVFLPNWWKRDDVPRKWLWERELSRRAEADGCDVFLSLYQSATVFKKRKARGRKQESGGVRHLMVVHDVIPRLFPEYLGNIRQKFHWKSVERGIRWADRIITVSEATKQDIIREIGVPGGRISVVYPDIGPSVRREIPDEAVSATLLRYGLKKGYIYHGGGLEIRKNTEKLLRAYALVRSRRDGIPPLVVSGRIFDEGNLLATPVKRIIRELGIEDSVLLLDFVPDEDIPALYRGALFFAYPSLYEGFGLPVVEAFSSGVPVLAGKSSGSVSEISGESAYLVDVSDTASIAEGIERLLDDSVLRTRLSEKGRYRAKDFSWKRFTESALKEIVAVSHS